MPKLFAVYLRKSADSDEIQVTELAIIETGDASGLLTQRQLVERGNEVLSIVPVADENDLCELIRLVYQAGMEHNNGILYGVPEAKLDYLGAFRRTASTPQPKPLWLGHNED